MAPPREQKNKGIACAPEIVVVSSIICMFIVFYDFLIFSNTQIWQLVPKSKIILLREIVSLKIPIFHLPLSKLFPR